MAESFKAENLEMLSSVIEALSDGILILNKNDQVVAFNSSFIRLWHLNHEIHIHDTHQKIFELIRGQLRNPDEFISRVEQIRNYPEIERFSDRIELNDGRILERSWVSQVIGTQHIGYILIYRDVTLQFRAEAFQTVFECADLGIALIDRSGKIVRVNPALEKMFGYSELEFQKLGIQGVSHPDDLSSCWDQLSRLTVGEIDEYEMEKRYIRKDGKVIWANLIGSLGRDSKGQPLFVIGMLTDITERKLYQEERERLLLQEWKAHQDTVKAIRLRDDFIAIGSHELRTPLTPLKLQIQFLQKTIRNGKFGSGEETNSLLKMANISNDQIDRLEQLAQDMLDASGLRAGGIVLSLEEFDLSEAVRKVAGRLKENFEKARCELILHLAEKVTGRWDRHRIEQVISSLLNNAIKFGQGSPVEMTTLVEGAHAVLIVRDQGIGISEEDHERIFEEFERVLPIEAYGGLGLGLYISYQIVQAHRGKIEVQSRLGLGTIFTVTLPIY